VPREHSPCINSICIPTYTCPQLARTRAQLCAGLYLPTESCNTYHHLHVIRRADLLSPSHRTGFHTLRGGFIDLDYGILCEIFHYKPSQQKYITPKRRITQELSSQKAVTMYLGHIKMKPALLQNNA